MNIFWFRRDLRLNDNRGLFEALSASEEIQPIFIFDENILSKLEDKSDKRVQFIYRYLERLATELHKHHGDLKVYYGKPQDLWPQIIKEFQPEKVYTNEDYEPYGIARDKLVEKLLTENETSFLKFQDHVIKKPGEALKDDGDPYSVYTYYKRKWLSELKPEDLKEYDTNPLLKNLSKQKHKFPSLQDIGFKDTGFDIPEFNLDEDVVAHYEKTRDFPANENGTTHIGVHLRFGTVSIRRIAVRAKELNDTYLSELIWREFFTQLLFFNPETVEEPFVKKYKGLKWKHNEEAFKRWCEGQTGYPIVDAGMRELNATGYMHNRVRMIVASFLTKHLLIDWKWGERYFAQKLLDYELASNIGNWQWAASTGADAQPYFRVFNPTTQIKKFDKDLKYIKKWVPEFQELDYPEPIVDHKEAREKAINYFKEFLGNI